MTKKVGPNDLPLAYGSGEAGLDKPQQQISKKESGHVAKP